MVRVSARKATEHLVLLIGFQANITLSTGNASNWSSSSEAGIPRPPLLHFGSPSGRLSSLNVTRSLSHDRKVLTRKRTRDLDGAA